MTDVTPFEVEVFYDGDCPLCLREIKMLRGLDKRGRIRFTNIMSPGFSAEAFGVSFPQLMARIHARLPDGTMIEGVEVFRKLYDAVGFKTLVRATRVSGVSHALDFAYEHFAKNRLRLTGRCVDGVCPLPDAKRA